MLPRLLIPSTLLVLLCATLPAQAQWTQTAGPLGGTLHTLAAPDGALLGSPGGPLFRYDGAAWSITEGIDTYGDVLAAGPLVYASHGNDLFHSSDGGLTFAPVSPEARRARLINLEGPRVWATTPTLDTLLVSADAGAAWDRYYDTAWVTSFGTTFEVGLHDVIGAVQEGDVVLAAGTAYVFGGVYRLAPTDTSWVRVLDLGQQVNPRSFVRYGGGLLVGSTAGVHVSSDGGATWADASTGLPDPQGVGVHLFPGTTALYAQVGAALFRWTGTDWAALPAFPAPYPLAVTAGERLFASAPEGVYALTNDGWLLLPRLLASSPIPVFADGPTAIVRGNGALSRTDDVGATWTTLTPLSGQVYVEGDFLLAVTPSGMRRSTDGGQTWTAAGLIPLPPSWNTLTPNGFAGHGGAVFAAYGGARYGHHGVLLDQYGAVFRSDDDGASWTQVSTGLPTGSFGHSPVRFIAGTGERLFVQTEHGCATSTGATWASAACPSGSVAELITEADRWLARSNHGVYASSTLGAAWTALTDGLPAPPGPDLFWFSSRLASVDGEPLLVGASDGTTLAYRLDGAAWTALALTFPEGVRWTGFAGGSGRLYGGTLNQGAWTTPLSLAAVAVTAAPVAPPVTIPAQGGHFDFTVTLTNTTTEPVTIDVWTDVAGPVSRGPVLGPRTVTLPAGATVMRTLRQAVPAAAPAGTYTYTLNAGTFPGTVSASSAFPFTKSGSVVALRTAGVESDWAVGGWDASADAGATTAEVLALDPPSPNPARDRVVLSFTLPEAADVRLAVYDVLGREVAVLLNGPAEAGAHAATLNVRALAAGTYVYRLVVGSEVLTGRLAVVR